MVWLLIALLSSLLFFVIAQIFGLLWGLMIYLALAFMLACAILVTLKGLPSEPYQDEDQ